MMGAVNSQGPALIFMDSHIEVTTGWLEPLLDRLAINKNITSISVMDTVDMDTLEYRYSEDPSHVLVTGFEWNMIFNWKKPYEPEGSQRKNPNDPISSPTMLGAFFGKDLNSSYWKISVDQSLLFPAVIDKSYFELLGMYDDGFEIWGAENLE
jgi:polypeptide N-acetylgalactosaminyltransferase